MVVGWHSIALVVHWHSVGSGVAKDSYNQILDFSPQWHFIDPQLIKEWKSKCWEWFFPVTGNLIFSSGRGLAQWHSSDRLATLCHWNQCPHFGQSCATQKLHPYYKTTAVADRQPKKVDHFTQGIIYKGLFEPSHSQIFRPSELEKTVVISRWFSDSLIF